MTSIIRILVRGLLSGTAGMLAAITVAVIDKIVNEPTFLMGGMQWVWLMVFVIFYLRVLRVF